MSGDQAGKGGEMSSQLQRFKEGKCPFCGSNDIMLNEDSGDTERIVQLWQCCACNIDFEAIFLPAKIKQKIYREYMGQK